MVITHRLSVEEYLALPEEKPYLEYIHGEAVPKMAPDWVHFNIAKRVVVALAEYERSHGGVSGVEGRVGFDDAGEVRFLLPDVAYYAPGRPQRAEDSMAPPTLAVEIRSPDETVAAQREKCHFYRAHGVDAAWLVDPINRAVEVFEGSAHTVLEPGEVLTSSALPGFQLPVGDLFEGLDA